MRHWTRAATLQPPAGARAWCAARRAARGSDNSDEDWRLPDGGYGSNITVPGLLHAARGGGGDDV